MFRVAAFAAAAVIWLGGAAYAESDVMAARDAVVERAFKPDRLRAGGWDYVAISYFGDDWGWPVQTVVFDCWSPCRDGWNAWSARAPIPNRSDAVDAYQHRPRGRGLEIVKIAAELREARPEASWDEIVRELPIEWLHTNSKQCPAASELLRAFRNIRPFDWAAPTFLTSNSAPPDFYIHTDTIKVEFGGFGGRATFAGLPFEGPGQQGNQILDALTPCWSPATRPAPWKSEQGPPQFPPVPGTP